MAITVKHPFGEGASVALTATGTQAITISNSFTVIDGVTVSATGNRTLNLTVSSELEAGALIFLKSKTDGTETTIFGTGFSAPTITGVAGKTKTQLLVYDGASFKPAGTSVQID